MSRPSSGTPGLLQWLPHGVVAILVGVAGLALTNPYHLQLLTFIGIHTLLALGLNMLMGYAGQVSLGHAAFFGIGAYTTAILSTTLNWSPWVALPCAVALAMAVALFVGLPTLRLQGYYLAMGTLGFGMIAYVILREWDGLTGGASGFVGIPPLTLGRVTLTDGRAGLYLIWALVLIVATVCGRIIRSRMGRALRAIHDGERAASAVGVDVMRLKLVVFVFSAGLAALAGFFYAHMVSFISPGTFDFLASIRMVTMVIVGGMASIWGAIFGAALITLLPEWLHAFADYEMTVYGFVMMVVMIVMPQGLTRGLLDLGIHVRRKIERNEPAAGA